MVTRDYLSQKLDSTLALTANAWRKLKNAEQKIEHIKDKSSICPNCGQPVISKELTAAERDLKTIQQNVNDFTREEQSIKSKLDMAIKTKLQTEQRASELSKETNPYTQLLADKGAAIAKAQASSKALKAEIKQLDEDYAAVSYWVGGFKRVRLSIIEETIKQLELEVNNSLASLGLSSWEVEFDVERENKSGGVTKGFIALVHPPGHKAPVKFEAWSGGITQRLRLAGDLGLSNLIMERAGLRSTIEFFDEPSRHLSQEGKLDLAETLNQRAISTEPPHLHD